MELRIAAITLALIFMLPLSGGRGQEKSVPGAPGHIATGSPATPEAPQLKTEDKFKIRDLQYSQAKVALEMKRLEARYKELQQQGAVLQMDIDEAVTVAAKNAGVDLTRWIFDADKLKFVARPDPKPVTPNPKP